MKKSSKKIKSAEGILKISSFFNKSNKQSANETSDTRIVKQFCNDFSSKNIVINSDDDFVDVPGERNKKKENLSIETNYLKDVESNAVLSNIKKRKITKIDKPPSSSPPQKRINVVLERALSSECQPSTSEYKSVNCSIRNSPGYDIFAKSPEKLLSTASLEEYNTPEKKMERFVDKIKTATPRKELFNEEMANGYAMQIEDNLHHRVDELRDTTEHLKNVFSEKNTPKKVKYTLLQTKDPIKRKTDKTQKKSEKTPKKLFDKSPNNLSKFNIQIIENFVKLTPSKTNKKDSNLEFIRSIEKKQTSILKYVSSAPSARSLEAQCHNESTPTKEYSAESSHQTSKSKVKAKLDFSECNTDKVSTSDRRQIFEIEMPKALDKLELSTENDIKSPKIPFRSPKCKDQINQKDQGNDLNLINVEDFSFNEDWYEEMEIPSETSYDLDLTESKHCRIISVCPSATKNVVTLKSTQNGQQTVCTLEGFWIHTQLSVGDTLHVLAKKLSENKWIINNDYGLLIYEPDLLVSTTSVVSTLWCKRRSILSERFRGFELGNQQMLVGILVHNLLQSVLKNKIRTREEIEDLAKNLVKHRNIIFSIYECGLKLKFIEEELLKYVPKIVHFIKVYVRNPVNNEYSNHNLDKEDWKGTIENIDDIEENIWCPELGIKGKVDVSIKTAESIMPLELKTGRASVSLEHRGQVMMYIMMMNKLGYNVPSGLLLYLREGVLREIPPNQKEMRDIIILRNELAYYLTRKPKLREDDSVKGKKLFPPDLPEPINHSSCAKCPYNVVCSSYAKYNNEDISSKIPLKSIQDEIFSYLEDSHLNYFMQWVSLIALESNSTKCSKDLREIYTLTPEERENNGKCIINLKITNIKEECNGVFEHTFENINEKAGVNFFANGIIESNYVVVSVNNRPAVSAGFVTGITIKSIIVTLDRNLNKKYANRTFCLDSYDSSSAHSYNLSSLTLLVGPTPRAEQLRRIIIDKNPPTFKQTLPKLIGTKGKQILRRLNIVQQRAVLKAIAAKEYFLIKGMPGTGKTATIVALIQLLVELGKSVLITSHTHSAVDNVCIRLVSYGVILLRLGSESRIHADLKEYSEHSHIKNCTTPEQLEAVYNNAQVLAVTCLGSGHPALSKRTMDICIVDESTQVVQSSVIRPLYSAKTFILIGDPDQLPAVIRDKDAIEMGMSESLFERLYTEESAIALNINYRMNSTITALANYLTYNGELLIGNEMIATANLKLPNKEVLTSTYNDHDWILKALDDSLENAVQYLDTGPVWKYQHIVPWIIHGKKDEKNSQNENQNCVNIYEAALVVNLVQALIKAGVPSKDIGVIATYRAQVAQISMLLQVDNVDVSTVDQFQGKDKNVIIYSSTKSTDTSIVKMENKFELLEDKRRLTVALTRAKHKLIIVGDVATLMVYSTFRKIMSYAEKNLIKLEETRNFNWETVLNINTKFV